MGVKILVATCLQRSFTKIPIILIYRIQEEIELLILINY